MNCPSISRFSSCQTHFHHKMEGVAEALDTADRGISISAGIAAYALDQAVKASGDALSATWQKTARFIKNNWKPLLVYVIAWGVIVSCTGLMYGFETVSLPLTIGLSCGIGFGIIVGVLTVKAFDSVGHYTLWNGLNYVIERLDTNGTRQVILSIAITVLLAAAVVFPYVLGAAFGILIGNQLAVKAATEQDLGLDPKKVEEEKGELQKQINAFREKLKIYKQRLQVYRQRVLTDQLTQQLNSLEHQLIAFTQDLENNIQYSYDDLPRNFEQKNDRVD